MKVVRLAMYTALVFVATIVLQVYTPATRGYFNLGEVAIYIIASLSSPLTAGFAGGVGSAIADLATGYGIFAPGTLAIKFLEGFTVSMIIGLISKRATFKFARVLSIVLALVIGLILAYVGVNTLSGEVIVTSVPISLGGLQLTLLEWSLTLPEVLWIVLSVAIVLMMIYFILTRNSENVSFVPAILTGGLIMVLGYFLYEFFISNPLQGIPPEQAILEVPVNLGQALVGLALASPAITFTRKAVGRE